MYRQGDILFIPQSIRASGEAEPRVNGALIIAHGERTGHMHQIKSLQAEVIRGGGARFLHADAEVSLTHDEHAEVKIPAGDYKIIQQQELQGETVRVVED